MTTADLYRPRRVAVVVICDVPAVDRRDASSLAEWIVGRALAAAPNRLHRERARWDVVLRHLVDDRVDDPRDLTVRAVAELSRALGDARLVTAVPLGEPEPPPTVDDEEP